MMNISALRKKLMYRSWHRGCKETDILLGYFASQYLNEFSMDKLIEYEKIADLDDYELYCYIVRKKVPPSELDSEILGLLVKTIETNSPYDQIIKALVY